MATLREQKEAFVSGHTGTTVTEISALAATPAILLVLWHLLQHPAAGGNGLFHHTSPTATGLALEFAALVLPQVAQLLGLVTPAALLGGATTLAAALFATQHSSEWQHRGRTARRRALTDVLRDSLSAYRACLMLVTCISILGVDFHAFPRRFAKAEAFGTGLMDAGVGSFVAASGLAHGLAAAARAAAQQRQRQPFGWRKEGGRALALLTLGLGRLLATGAADYQNHASEYGAHWNFFLTLAALRLLGLLTPWATGSAGAAAATGSMVLAVHQRGLSAWGLIDVVHSSERHGSLLRANKEGLLSLPGYWALQLLGTAAGHFAYRMASAAAVATTAQQPGDSGLRRDGRGSTSDGSSSGSRLTLCVKAVQPQQLGQVLRLLIRLAVATVALWLVYWAATTSVQPVSRRACNAGYVLWVLALNVQCVALFVGVELLLAGHMPQLLLAVSASMLPFFLGANLLTGVTNLATNTLAASDRTTVLLVSAYMAALCGSAVVAHGRRQHKQM